MSTDTPSLDDVRDRSDELQEPEAGEIGTPVDARCTGCKRVRAKKATKIHGDDPASGSFRHICHRCCKVKWWNVLRLIDTDAPTEGSS
jgi:hypothetical protein